MTHVPRPSHTGVIIGAHHTGVLICTWTYLTGVLITCVANTYRGTHDVTLLLVDLDFLVVLAQGDLIPVGVERVGRDRGHVAAEAEARRHCWESRTLGSRRDFFLSHFFSAGSEILIKPIFLPATENLMRENHETSEKRNVETPSKILNVVKS